MTEAVVDAIEALIHSRETPVDCFEAPVDAVEASIHAVREVVEALVCPGGPLHLAADYRSRHSGCAGLCNSCVTAPTRRSGRRQPRLRPVIDDVIELLRCPHCGAALDLEGPIARCAAGHSFDVARQGYLNLLPGNARTGTADTAAMVRARAAFLAAGHYAPIAAAVDPICATAGSVAMTQVTRVSA